MSNYFQNYYQGKRGISTPGRGIKKMYYYRDQRRQMSPKQKLLWNSLIAFFKDHELSVLSFSRPRDYLDLSDKLHMMFGILRKHNLTDEFMALYEQKKLEEGL